MIERWKTSAQQFIQLVRSNKRWIAHDIAIPFVISRLALACVGWFSQYLVPNPNYPVAAAVARGWHFSPLRLLDIWGRWDTGWYMDIVQHGYRASGNIEAAQSSIAFFPLYPYLVRFLAGLIPEHLRTTGVILAIGVAVSNLCLLGALILLHRLVVSFWGDPAVARRAVLYLLLFPTSFYLSCFYTEAAFLFLSVSAFYAAFHQRWAASSFLGGLLAMTRPLGIFIVLPLAWMYMATRGWRLRKIGWDGAWFLLVPAGLLVFLLGLYPLTGDWLAPFHAHAAWGRAVATPWQTLAHPQYATAYVTPVERVLTIAFLVLGIGSLALLRPGAYGIYALLLLAPTLASGTLMSSARFCAVILPAFIVLAWLGKRKAVDQFIVVTFLTLQTLFMAAWSQFYWIG